MTGEEIKEILLSLNIEPDSGIHGHQQFILLRFQSNPEYIRIIKANKGMWSKTWNAWYIPRNKNLLIKIIRKLAELKSLEIRRLEVSEMIRKLELKSYSQSTRKNYCNAFEVFLDYFYPRPAKEISKRDIESYLLYLQKKGSKAKPQ